MSLPDQSFSALIRNIIVDVQDLIRSEIRFVKAELWDQAKGLRSAAFLIGAGTVTALFAALFALCSLVLALALVLPPWAAALIVAAVLAAAGAYALRTGLRRAKQVHVVPVLPQAKAKENVQ
jgi:lipopolysaccharide export LptBFGC system permease protein LptF